MTVVYLIRHAEALSREEWSEQDKDRPLTERGRKQARNIAADLKKSGVSSLRTSPARRCHETVAPLAEALGLKLVVDKGLFEGGGPIELPRDGGIHALCSHGDRIPETLDAFGVAWDKCKKGSVWKLEIDSNGKVAKSQYLPPSD